MSKPIYFTLKGASLAFARIGFSGLFKYVTNTLVVVNSLKFPNCVNLPKYEIVTMTSVNVS